MDLVVLHCPSWALPLLALCSWLVYEIGISWRLACTPFPLVGSRTGLVPRFALNLIFACNAAGLLQRGYREFKHQVFQLIRNDGSIVVLPQEMVAELSSLPLSIASPQEALEHDLLGHYTGLNLILRSRLHHSIVQRKLTPRLGRLTPGLERELRSALEDVLPDCTQWTAIEPYNVLGYVSARLSARALVGARLARSPEWLDLSVNYTENLFRTIVVLRLFPTWSHRILCLILPSYWTCNAYIRSAKALLAPLIDGLLQNQAKSSRKGCHTNAIDGGDDDDHDHDDDDGVEDNHDDDSDNALNWLADAAKGEDRDSHVLAHVEVLLALASVHTTLLRMVNVLYDVTDNPSYFHELREEIQQVEASGWDTSSYDRLHKLDSILRESQRLSPPTILGMKRLMKQRHVFSNGVDVRKGAYVCLPTFAIENDPQHTVNPNTFDGLRNHRLRQQTGEEHLHQFTSPEPTILNFGYGKSACPGRFFAGRVLKIVFVKLLCEYDFEFLHGTGRPRNVQAHEFLFPRPWDKISIKRRVRDTAPF